eukprot:SAG31_NODE_1476_length_8195_cov_2.521863_5_plen_69_part_00
MDFPYGRLEMKADISTFSIGLPSSARTFTAVGSVTTNSRPVAGQCQNPRSDAVSRTRCPGEAGCTQIS